MIKRNSDHAKEAATLSMTANTVATKGEREIGQVVSSIQEIAADSKKIEEIINVIDDIAFQTNLLALNAAVEAARAGEQGKGFAVVAEAVRTLAQRSASAAKDIGDLIKGSVEKIERGSEQAAQGGAVLSEIVTSIKRVSDLNTEIDTASAEQAHGISQISQVMNSLDSTTQLNAAAAEESAAASEELSAQATTMKSNVELLKGIVNGDTQAKAA